MATPVPLADLTAGLARTPVVDLRTGLMTPPWLRFFAVLQAEVQRLRDLSPPLLRVIQAEEE